MTPIAPCCSGNVDPNFKESIRLKYMAGRKQGLQLKVFAAPVGERPPSAAPACAPPARLRARLHHAGAGAGRVVVARLST